MNNCPNCKQKPISLMKWSSGLSSLKHKCDACGTELKANMMTWLSLALIVVAMCLIAYISITQYDVHFQQDRLLLIGLVSIPAILGSFIRYAVSGYKKAK